MPHESKGARLWLKPAYEGENSSWVIRDGARTVRTGCSPSDRGEAEKRLSTYLVEKYKPKRDQKLDPSAVYIADVISIYCSHIADKIKRPKELGQRATRLLAFFAGKKLSEINGQLCRDYADQRGSLSMARRELEDLRAAIVHHRKEGLCNAIVEIVLPDKAQSRERWLTRSEAAKMIWAAWRYRETQKGHMTGRRSRRHIARFMLVALYTGTRSAAICGASIGPSEGRGHVDLNSGIFYRKAPGAIETKKRQPTIRIPARLLVHLRRWHRLNPMQQFVVEFAGKPVERVTKAFARVAIDAKVADVTPHVLRHTAVTWAMQNAADRYAAADFFGMTFEVLDRVYGHHHPDHHKGVGDALTRR